MGGSVLRVVLLAVALTANSGASQPWGSWQWANPLPQGNSLTDVAYGRGAYVAVGQAGTVLVSRDAKAWEVVRIGTSVGLRAVTWGDGLFTAVGDAGTVALSPDGQEWMVTTVGSSESLTGAASGHGRTVVVGTGGAIFWSVDGSTWQRALSPTTADLAAVTFSGTRFVAAEGDGSNAPAPAGILASVDGVTWARTPIPEAMFFRALAGNGSRLLAAGAYCAGISPWGWCDPGALVSVSDDGGTSWSTTKPQVGAFTDVVWTGSGFLALMGSSTATSVDGLVWHPLWRSAAGPVAALTSGDAGLLVAVGTGGCISTSLTGRKWDSILSDLYRPDLVDAVWDGTQFVAVGPGLFSSPALVMVSPDGLVWSQVSSGAFEGRWGLIAIASHGSTLVALGDAYIASSQDGVSWSVVASWDASSLFRFSSVAWTGTRFVAVGSRLGPDGGIEGLAVASPDGFNWTELHTEPGVWFHEVAAHEDTVVVTAAEASGGLKTRIYVSTELGPWQEVPGITLSSPGAIVWAGSQFTLVAGTPPRTYTSPDGLSWVDRGAGVPDGLFRLRWDGREIIGVGYNGVAARSADGGTWYAEFSGTWNDLFGIASGQDRVIAVGRSTTVLWRQCEGAHRVRRHLTR